MIQRMTLRLLVALMLASSAWSANVIAKANAGLVTNTTWGAAEAGASAAQTTKSASTNTTTSYVYSSAFTCTNADVIDGLLLYANRVNTTGTVSVALSDDNGVTATRSVTINASDLPTDATFVFFKFGSTLTCDGGADYKVGVLGSSNANATFYRDGTGGNWTRLLRTTADRTPVAADNFYVAGEWTAAATVTARTVTMDETAITDYGTMDIGLSGTVTYGNTASTAYYLRLSGDLNIWSGGTFNMGTTGSSQVASSTAKLNMDSGSNVQYGIKVNNGATWVIRGASKTVSAFLAADASAGATTLTSDVSTSWLSGDEIALAPTSRTAAQFEKKTMSGAATGTSIPIAALTNAHSGTSPTRGELGNLTRNVQIFGASASLQTYVVVSATGTVDWDYGEFYWMGSGNGSQRGIDLNITTSTATINHCSIHDFVVASSAGVQFNLLTSGTITISNNVFYNIALNPIVISSALSSSNWSITGNLIIGSTASFADMVFLADVSGVFSNNTITGTDGSSRALVLNSASNDTWGTFSGNTIHSVSNVGIKLNSAITTVGTVMTFTNTTIWRSSAYGFWQGTNTLMGVTLFFDGITAFGNANMNIFLDGHTWNVIINNAVLSGDSSFSSGYGIQTGTSSYTNGTIYNSTFGVASGIKVAHTSADIGIGQQACGSFSGSNDTFASTNVIADAGVNPNCAYLGIDSWAQTAGSNRNYRRIGNSSTNFTITQTDTSIYKTASPSQRITPVTALAKAKSSIKTLALASGTTSTIAVWVRKSVVGDGAAYNGSQPRLIVQRNPACGIGTGSADVVLATASGAAGSWEQLSGTTSAVTADCTLSVYVDLDGTLDGST